MGLFARFADLLDYPGADVEASVEACLAEMVDAPREAREALGGFRDQARQLGLSGLEEAYTVAFDLDVRCTPYVGHHLFGENTPRGLFMARLVAAYRAQGFAAPPAELPDHLAVMLRYLDLLRSAGGAGAEDLVGDAIVPASRLIADALDRRRHPYAPVLHALIAVLEPAARAAAGHAVGTTA